MKKRVWGRGLAVLALVLVLVVASALPAAASGSVPQPVLDAQNGVVRIVTMYDDGFAVGTGFAIGTESKPYIATNYHVIEDGQEIRVYYATGKYVNATIRKEVPARDLCILELSSTIRGLQILPLQTNEVTRGIAVYALGYPAASDMLSGDWYNYDYNASNIVADKEAMTFTAGVISVIRDSKEVGDLTRDVATIQNTASISGGNSGGPLLDAEANVVGINTMHIPGAEGMNSAVHVSELISVLRSEKIKFNGPPEPDISSSVSLSEPEISSTPVVEEKTNVGLWVGVGVLALVVVAGVVAAVLVSRKKAPAGITLEEHERRFRRLSGLATLDMVQQFISGELLPLSGYDLNPLLDPANILIDGNEMVLKEKTAHRAAGQSLDIFPGYSAPENYTGGAGMPATVYFVGAVMVTLNTGRRPPDAPGRKEKNEPVFPEPNTLQNIINQAMEPYEPNRTQTLHQLQQQLAAARNAVWMEDQNHGQ